MTNIGNCWEVSGVNEELVSDILGIWSYLSKDEGFSTASIARKDAPAIDLARISGIIRGPDDFLMGANGIRNISFAKKDGNFQGTLVLYKDKMVFVSSFVYQIGSYHEAHKDNEIAKVNVELKRKAEHLGYGGDPDNFWVWRPYAPTKDNVLTFVKDIKTAFRDDKLRVRI